MLPSIARNPPKVIVLLKFKVIIESYIIYYFNGYELINSKSYEFR